MNFLETYRKLYAIKAALHDTEIDTDMSVSMSWNAALTEESLPRPTQTPVICSRIALAVYTVALAREVMQLRPFVRPSVNFHYNC